MNPEAAPTDEFAAIARWFAPLARHPAARSLLDDAAVIEAAGPLVLTADAIVEGVHFLPDDPLDLVARKALRVNLSDLAAKGAAPLGYLLTVQWPHARPADGLGALAAGLAADDGAFEFGLLGGDTTRTPGPLALSVTMIGRAPPEGAPDRRAGRAGDLLVVTGTIGDGALGLLARQGRLLGASAADAAWLARRYQTPEPRNAFAPALAGWARAAMDVSDGLLADAAKLAAASRLGAEIDLAALPVSEPAARWLARQDAPMGRIALATGGDDYEILAAVSPQGAAELQRAGAALGLPITVIGRLTEGAGLVCLDGSGGRLTPDRLGYVHALGR